MEEYLKTLLEQIRCKKARNVVEEEIRGHLEEQIEEYQMAGMNPKEAEKAAVLDMGDPVQTGISLDGIHRPRISWKLVILIGVISLLSILIQTVIGISHDPAGGLDSGLHHGMYVLVGFALMIFIYRLDYSFLGRNVVWVALGFFLVLLILRNLAIPVNGSYGWTFIGGVRISLRALLYLWPPLYGALLYKYYGRGYKGIVKSFLWILFPACYAWGLPDIALAFLIFFISMILLSMAVFQGWFQVKRGRTLAVVWSVVIFLPALELIWGVAFHGFAEYQIARLETYLRGENKAVSMLAGSRWLGKGMEPDLAKSIEYNSDYILSYLSSYYGILAAFLMAALVLGLILAGIKTAGKGKNRLGRMIGFASGLSLLLPAGINILVNLGLFPEVNTFLPFLSKGNSYLLVSYVLLGLILSVYRYKNILSEKACRRIRPAVK